MGFGLTQYVPFLAYCCFILAVVFTLVKTPRVGLYLLALLVPLQNLVTKLAVFPLGKDIVDILVVVIAFSFYIHKNSVSLQKHRNKVNFFVFLLIPVTYTSLWVGSFKFGYSLPVTFENPQLIQWKNFILMPILYFIVLKTVEDKKQLVLITLIMAGTLLLTDLRFYNTAKWSSHEHFSWDNRTEGTTFAFLGPNEVAAFYAMTAMLFIGLGLTEKTVGKKLLFLGTACFNLYPVMFLYSRGAYAAVLAGLLFYGVAKKRIILVLIFALFVSWHTVLPNSVVERIEMTTASGGVDSSSMSRIELWTQAISVVKINPISGVGFGGTRKLGFKTHEGHSRNDVHNGYIEILLEQGIVGLFIMLSIFYWSLKKGWELYENTNDPFLKGLGLGFVGMTIASIVANVFGDRWSYFSTMGYFWITFAMVVKARMLYPLKEPVKSPATVSTAKTVIPAQSH